MILEYLVYQFLLSLLYRLFFYNWIILIIIQTCYWNTSLKKKIPFLTLYSPPIATRFFYSPLQQKVYTSGLCFFSSTLMSSLPLFHLSRSPMTFTLLNIMTKFQLSLYFTKQLHLPPLITPPPWNTFLTRLLGHHSWFSPTTWSQSPLLILPHLPDL